jgi:transcriptional regulator with XRE-family HTH domain
VDGEIRRFRLAQGLTVSQFARAADMTRKAIYDLEAGRYTPRLETLIRLAEALRVPLGDIAPAEVVERVRRALAGDY